MKLSRRLADQTGVALPVALALLFAVAGLATVAARAAITATNQSFRDRSVKRAIQAANAGLHAARYQTNLMLPANTQCVVKNPTTGDLSNAAVQADGWCAAQTEDLGDGASYSVTVSQVVGSERTVVATGTAGGVQRRALLKMAYSAGGALPLDRALLSDNPFTLENNVNVTGDVGSNGSITTSNNAYICGDLTPGPGQTWNHGSNSNVSCGGATTPATQPFTFPPVDQAGSQTTNDNGRLTRMKNNGANPKDTCSDCGGISWNETTRVLDMDNNATLTLGGSVYNFCRFEMTTNNTLNISSRPATTPMKIYIDSPENCSGSYSGKGSILMENNSRVYYLGSSAKVIEVYVAGSTTTATSVQINNNAGSGNSNSVLFIYGPNSDIRLHNNVVLHGAAIGKTLRGYNSEGVGNNVTVTYSSAIAALTPTTLQGYTSHSYRECTSSPTGTTPDTGC